MPDLFETESMAAGYARARPPVHPWVLERVRERLGIGDPLPRALDVGCGAGLSTRALSGIARERVGLDPAASMVRRAPAVAPGAAFVVGRAEDLPLQSRSFDLITAAGSLNYADLARFFPEADRVLRPGGVIVVYDFGQGRSFRDSPALAGWFAEFSRLHPLPAGSGQEIGPTSLASAGRPFRLHDHLDFELALPFTRESYVDYLMSEANVPWAVASGAAEPAIRSWCAETLGEVFGGASREVVFTGYVACLDR